MVFGESLVLSSSVVFKCSGPVSSVHYGYRSVNLTTAVTVSRTIIISVCYLTT